MSVMDFVFGDVTPQYGDIALLICVFITGMVDAATFNNYFAFVGMQTGNTVILGLSTAGFPIGQPHAWLTTLVSIVSFIVGAVVTFAVSRSVGPLRRITVTMNFFVQGCLILLSAALVTGGIAPRDTWRPSATRVEEVIAIDVPIPALSLNFGSQIAMSRILGYNELPTTVLTSTYADLAGDADFFAWNNVKRNRRLAAAILQLAGAIVAGWIQRSTAGESGVYWLGGGMKVLLAIGVFLFMKPLNVEAKAELPTQTAAGKLQASTKNARG